MEKDYKNNKYDEIMINLNNQLLKAKGAYAAFSFVKSINYERSEISTKIQELEEFLTHSSEDIADHIYQKSFLITLRELLRNENILVNKTSTLTLSPQQLFINEGERDAYIFALECQGNLGILNKEIQEVEKLIDNPPNALKGPMSLGASPRLYKDGYLRGLKQAVLTVLQ